MVIKELVDIFEIFFGHRFEQIAGMVLLFEKAIPLRHGFGQWSQSAAFSSGIVTGFTVLFEEVFTFTGIASFNSHNTTDAESRQDQTYQQNLFQFMVTTPSPLMDF